MTGPNPELGVAAEPEAGPSWAERSRLGGLQSVVDPDDVLGRKSRLIDRAHRWALRRASGPLLDRTIVDYGCGVGRLSAWLRRQGATVIGVDTSPEMVAEASRRDPLGRYSTIDDGRIPTADGSVDLVVVVWVFQYLVRRPDSFDPVLGECRRVLRPGGRLICIEQLAHTSLGRGGSIAAYMAAMTRAGFAVERPKPLRLGRSPMTAVALRVPRLLGWAALPTLLSMEARLGGRWTPTSGYCDALMVARRLL